MNEFIISHKSCKLEIWRYREKKTKNPSFGEGK